MCKSSVLFRVQELSIIFAIAQTYLCNSGRPHYYLASRSGIVCVVCTAQAQFCLNKSSELAGKSSELAGKSSELAGKSSVLLYQSTVVCS